MKLIVQVAGGIGLLALAIGIILSGTLLHQQLLQHVEDLGPREWVSFILPVLVAAAQTVFAIMLYINERRGFMFWFVLMVLAALQIMFVRNILTMAG